MAREYRRIVTGHIPEGKSTVLYDSPMPLLEADTSLYHSAEQAFGRQGLVDIALLIGRYLTICTLLNGFDILRP